MLGLSDTMTGKEIEPKTKSIHKRCQGKKYNAQVVIPAPTIVSDIIAAIYGLEIAFITTILLPLRLHAKMRNYIYIPVAKWTNLDWRLAQSLIEELSELLANQKARILNFTTLHSKNAV